MSALWLCLIISGTRKDLPAPLPANNPRGSLQPNQPYLVALPWNSPNAIAPSLEFVIQTLISPRMVGRGSGGLRGSVVLM